MLRVRLAIALAVLLSCLIPAVNVEAQKAEAKRQPKPGDAASDQSHAERRAGAVHRVRALVDQVASFQSIRDRTLTLSELADLLWDYDVDYAREIFMKTYASLPAELPPASKQTGAAQTTPKDVARLRQELISRIAKRDIGLAWDLSHKWFDDKEAEATRAGSKADAYLGTAFRLVEDKPKDAMRFAEQSLNAGVSQSVVSFLQTLRSKDDVLARLFFARVLSVLSSQSAVDANNLLLLGTYVFSLPAEVASGSLNSISGIGNGVIWAQVGSLLVVSISGREPAVSPDEVKAYLGTAVSILGRPVRARQKPLYYVAGYQLLPYVKRYLPERSAELESYMQSLSPDLPPALNESGSYANLSVQGVRPLEQVLRDIDKDPIRERRDAVRLGLVHSACLMGDFVRARSIAADISDLNLKYDLRGLIDFSEGAKLLGSGELAAAQEKASKLDVGTAQAALWVGLGSRYAEVGDNVRAFEALNAALQLARKQEAVERSALTLAVANGFSRFDAVLAGQALGEAVRAFNQIEDGSPLFTWHRKLSAGGIDVSFSLQVKGVTGGFGRVLEHRVASDPQGTTVLILTLKNEQVLARAVVDLASAILKST